MSGIFQEYGFMKVLKRTGLGVAVAAALSAFAAGSADANTVYTYAGNNFTLISDEPVPSDTYDTSMRIKGSFTVASPLAANLFADIRASVLSFSFFDGRNTITQLNADPVTTSFLIKTDVTGAPIAWQIQLTTPNPKVDGAQFFEIFVQNDGGGGEDFGQTDQCVASVSADCSIFFGDQATSLQPGVFSSTPVPAALPLFASGLGAMGLLSWRRKRKIAAAILA